MKVSRGEPATMNQKAYSVLLCALLASTFYHETRASIVARPPYYGGPGPIRPGPVIGGVGAVGSVEQVAAVGSVAVQQQQAAAVGYNAGLSQQVSSSFSETSSRSESSSYSSSSSSSSSSSYNANSGLYGAANYAAGAFGAQSYAVGTVGYGGVYQPVIDGRLLLYSNPGTNYLALYNKVDNAAAIFNVNANQIALLNGAGGYGTLFDLQANRGSYFTYEQSSSVWQSQTTSFESYFHNFNNFDAFSGINGAVSYTSTSASETIKKSFSSTVSSLWSRSGLDFSLNYQKSIDYTIALSSQFLTSVQSFNGLPAIFGPKPVTLGFDYPGLVNALQGLNVLTGSLPDGFNSIIRGDSPLNFHDIFGAENGIEGLTQLLYQVGPHYDLGVFTSILNTPASLFNLLVKLGGNVNWGVTGALKIILGLITLDSGADSFYELLTVIIEFSASTHHGLNGRLDQLLTQLQNLLFFNNQKNYAKAFSGLSSCINGFRDKTLVINKINIVEILELLIAGVKRGPDYSIQLIISILIKVRTVIDINVSIPALLVSLLLDLNNPLGLDLVNSFGWNLGIKPGPGNILPQFISVDHLAPLVKSKPWGLLTGLPVLKNVVNYVSEAFVKVSASYDISINLRSVLDQSSYFSDLLGGVFRQVGFVLFPASRSVLASVQNISRYVVSLESLSGLTNSPYAYFNSRF